jgi:hypothetical protein
VRVVRLSLLVSIGLAAFVQQGPPPVPLINGFNLNATDIGDCEVEIDSTGTFGRLRELLEAELPFWRAVDRNPWTGYSRKLASA